MHVRKTSHLRKRFPAWSFWVIHCIHLETRRSYESIISHTSECRCSLFRVHATRLGPQMRYDHSSRNFACPRRSTRLKVAITHSKRPRNSAVRRKRFTRGRWIRSLIGLRDFLVRTLVLGLWSW